MSESVLRNVQFRGRRTSMRLESPYWEAIDEICQREQLSFNDLCAIVGQGQPGASLTSAVRLFVVRYFRAAATERGHSKAGHGRTPALFKDRKAGINFTTPVKHLHRLAN